MKMCISRITVTSLLYTFNISIVFLKSQQLLQAFLSKTIITETSAKRAKQFQWFIMIVLLLLTATLIVISCRLILPFSNYLDKTEMERVYFCNTSPHNNLVSAFFIVLQFGCFVQAFRGRHLPSVMNDGMCLVYTALTTTIMFTVMYIIVLFQEPVVKEIYQSLTILVNTLVILLMMYTQKAMRMLFYPKKNTKIYFQKRRLSEMRRNIDDQLNRRSKTS